MFKSKSKIEYPDAPKTPSWDLMMEDLKVAPKVDVLFSLCSKDEKEFLSVHQQDVTDKMNDDQLFNQALNFIQQSDKLEEDLITLEDKRETLKEISERLQECVEKVKKQASLAISKS